MLRLLRAEPARSVFCEVEKVRTVLRHGAELWNADWHSVQNSKAQPVREHTAFFMAALYRAAKLQRIHDRRDSSCLSD